MEKATGKSSSSSPAYEAGTMWHRKGEEEESQEEEMAAAMAAVWSRGGVGFS